MRVALISTTPPGKPGSMGVYGDLVLGALREHAPWIDVTTVALRPSPSMQGRGVAGRLTTMAQILKARRASAHVQADVCHLLDGSFGYLATGLPLRRTLVTVHDLIPALQARGRFPVDRPGWAARRLIGASLRLVREAGAVCAVSQSTARDVLGLTGRVVDAVILNPLRPLPGEGLDASVDQMGRRQSPSLLHVGNNAFYKNRAGVLRIFATMAAERPDLRLAMAGPAPTAALLQLSEQLGIGARQIWVKDPDDIALAKLYREAAVLLFPSLYEGFGWPPLEALSKGCPVVCANTGALPEVVGDAALLWDPCDEPGFAAQALRLLADEALARQLIARAQSHLRGFSTGAMAEGLVALYARLAGA